MNRQTELVYAAALCLLIPSLTPSRLTSTYVPPPQGEQKSTRIKDLSKLNDTKVTMSLADTSIRTALNDLFKETNINYCIIDDKSISGTATFSVKDVPFEGALVSILRASRKSNLTYKTISDILVIHPQFDAPTFNGNDVARADNLRVKMNLEDADIRLVIGAFFQSLHVNYVMDQHVAGKISVSCDSLPYSEALDKVLKASKVPLKVSSENNVFRIDPM